MYQFLRKILFTLDAERAHYLAMNIFQTVCRLPVVRSIIAGALRPVQSPKSLFGVSFKNPVGLGAGFDKNAKYLAALEAIGFGFVEIGTVTPRPQAGNEKPRLFRLPEDGALINRMGFNNEGVDVVAKRLKAWQHKKRNETHKMLIGGNIGKNKTTPNEDAWQDYEICFRALYPYVDFFVVNVSSPNTPGLRELQEKDALKKILTQLQLLNKNFEQQKPILLKIAPDLTNEQLDDVVQLAQEIKLDGLVATNTTIERKNLATNKQSVTSIGAGGLSGKPVQERATEVIRYIQQQTKGNMPIIGSGGIFTAADAKNKLSAGASLVEVWTGFIYEGPSIVKRICNALP